MLQKIKKKEKKVLLATGVSKVCSPGGKLYYVLCVCNEPGIIQTTQ
jgi:hypothetical protein